MSIETIARRYATALADVLAKSGETDNVRAELFDWQKLIEDSRELAAVFENPTVAHTGKEKILDELLARTRPSRTTANFLRILVRNDRLADLPAINRKLDDVLAERSGTLTAQVTSARELSEPQKDELRTSLEAATGRSVDLSFGIDESIIGGVVTRIGSTVYDGSVKTRLENLKSQMING